MNGFMNLQNLHNTVALFKLYAQLIEQIVTHKDDIYRKIIFERWIGQKLRIFHAKYMLFRILITIHYSQKTSAINMWLKTVTDVTESYKSTSLMYKDEQDDTVVHARDDAIKTMEIFYRLHMQKILYINSLWRSICADMEEIKRYRVITN